MTTVSGNRLDQTEGRIRKRKDSKKNELIKVDILNRVEGMM